MKNLYIILITVIVLAGSVAVQAQSRTVSGTVMDAAGTLPGISVLEKDVPSNGISTNGTGQFKLTLRGKSNILVFKGLGYATQEISVAKLNSVEVTMEPDSKGLEEVVVVGFGTQRKIDVVGSVSTVSREEIQQTPSASLQNALTGKLPGYFSQQRNGQPGVDGADFVIRGVNTLDGGNVRPLILVDDIEFSYADFSNIDPNDVESLSILKDAGSTAVYGIKGANGVILVTTRRGKTGTPKINFRTEFGMQVPTQVPQVLGSADAATLRNEALRNDAFISGATYVPEFSDADIELFRNGSDPYGHPDVDWYKTLFRKAAPTASSNFDLSGGTERVKYFVSLGYESQSGLLRDFKASDVDNGFHFNRYNFRSNLDMKASKSLNLRLDVSAANTVRNEPRFGDLPFGEIFNYEALSPYVYPPYNPDGSYGFASPLKPQPNPNIMGRLETGGYNRDRANLLNLNLSAIQNLEFITPGLNAKITASISNQHLSTRSLTRVNFPQFYYDPVAETYTPVNQNVFRVDPYDLAYGAGAPRRQTGIQAQINYNRSFKNHNISALIVGNQYSRSKSDPGVTNYIPSNSRGVSSRLSYNFKSKYIVEVTGAYNGTDAFAASRRYGFFPAGLAGWVVSEENFIKNNLPVLSLLKFRASYGLTGSDDLRGFKNSYEEIYGHDDDVSFGESNVNSPTIIPGSLSNDRVTWEKERKLDYAVEFGILKNKISGSVNFFNNRRYDILSRKNTIPTFFGITDAQLPPLNYGIMSNSGHEIELAYRGKIGSELNFNIRGNYSYAKNKIVEIDEAPDDFSWKRQTGRSIGERMGYIWDGYYTEAEAKDPTVPKYVGSSTAAWGDGTTLPGFLKYRDISGDGVISEDDRGFFGLPNLPNTIIGLATGFTFKSFSLNVMLQSALNSDVQIAYQYADPFKGNLMEIHKSRWTPETAGSAEFPALITNFLGSYMNSAIFSDFWAVSGDYLRIKSVEVGYRLPSKWLNTVGLQSARVFASGYNLHTWSASFKRYGVDPEVARDAYSTYPTQAIFNLGLNISLK